MFEFKGKEYDLATVEGWAKDDNKTLDDYISLYGLKDLREGKTTPTTPGAVVEETAAPELTLTESPSVDISLDLPKDKEPSVAESLAAVTVRGITNFFRGTQAIAETAALSTYAGIRESIMNDPMTANEKIAFRKALAMGVPGSNVMSTAQYDNIISDINEHVRKTESEGVTDALTKGKYGEAAELAVGGMLESIPSVAASFLGVGGLVLLGGSVAGNKFDEEFEINPKESLNRIALNAIGTGVTEAAFERFTMGLAGRAKAALGSGKKGAAESAKKILEEGFLKAGKRLGLDIGGEALSEGATEAANIGVDYLTLDRELPTDQILKRISDGAIIGGLMGGTLSSVSAIGNNSNAARNRAEYILTPEADKKEMQKSAAKISNLALDLKNADENATKIIQEELAKEEQKIIDIKKKTSINLQALNKNELSEYAKNIDEIEKAKQVKEPLSAANIAKEKIKTFTDRNNEIIAEAKERQVEQTIISAEKAAKDLNIKFNAFETAQEVEEYLGDRKDSKTIAKTKDGFIIQRKDGSQEIVINKEVAKETEAVNVAAHELLHGILFKTLKDNPQVAINLGQELASEINKLNSNQIQDSILKRRLELYRTDPDSIQGEELLALFSDATATGDIKYNENIFTKIGDSIRRLLQDLGFKKIQFNNGRDVYNFIKDYNKGIKEGGVRKAIINQAAKGFTGKLVDVPKTTQEDVTKFSKSDSANKVQQIFDEKGKDGAFDIIEAYKPLTTKLTNKYRDVPGFDFELLQSEIEIGKRGLLDLINAYDPSKGATLNTYIQGQLANRSIEAANRILDTEFKLDVTEAKGVTDTVTAEETIERKEEKPTKELESLRKKMNVGDEIKPIVFDAVRKTFGTKLPSVTEKAFKTELEKSFRTELKKPIAKLMGRTEDYRSFLSNNFEAIYDALPQYIINKRLTEFAEPVIGEDGKQIREKTAEGKKVFTKKKISKAEWIKYFLGNEVGRSTQGTRKTALAEALSEAFALDATMEVLSNPEVAQKAMDIAELQGFDLSDDFVDKVSSIINRPINFKFSKARKALNLQAGSINFKNKNQVLSARDAMLKLAKTLGPEKAVQYLLPTVQGGWGSIGGKFIFEKDINKLTVKELEDPNDKNSFRTNQFLFIGRADFFEEAKKIFNSVEYKKRKRSVNINGEQISILAVPNQSPKGFNSGKFEGEELQNRLYFAKIQREGLKSIINTIKQLYENNEISKNDVGMILATFNSSVNALIRTAAYPGLQFKVDGLKDSDYRYEHTQTASDTLTELAKYITIKNYKFTFDNIMQGFRIAIIPKSYDKIVNSTGFKSNGPRDINGDLIKGKSTNVVRYNQKEVTEAFKKQNLPKLELEDLLNDNLSIKSSKPLNKEFNKLLEQSTGVKFTKQFSPVEARILGKGKGRNKFFIPYSADDFVGLLYTTLASGKTGDQQMEWYRENLLRPFSRGIQQYEAAKQNALREWQILKKEAKKNVPGGLTKKNATGLSNQDAVRIYIWNQQGMDIPDSEGSKALINENIKIVKKNKELKAFAERLMALQPEGYPEPSKNWDSGDITTDIVSYINGVKRSEFLTEWKDNVDIIFSDKNKEKLRALYGDRYVEALDDILQRMRTGTNRKFGTSRIEQQFMDWTNNSVGAIMFFNARSAVLQTLSAVNFINFTDNNPLNAALALGNQPQYWKDFATLFNSDFLKQRRSGLQTDVNADEIARAAKGAENTARAALSAILKFGFTPTQIADSFAIASGGATFYRNRINKYKKEGSSQREAEQ